MWAFALSSRWTYFCRCPSSQWGCFRQTSAEWQTVKGTWRHLQTFWSKWRIPPCSPVCIKTLQAVSPCFRKKFKKRNQFYWFVKGLPICWLEKGGESKQNKPFADHSYGSSVTAFSRYSWSPDFFFFVCKILSYFNGVKRSTFKKPTGSRVQGKNGSSGRYLQGLEISTLIRPFDLSRHAPIF